MLEFNGKLNIVLLGLETLVGVFIYKYGYQELKRIDNENNDSKKPIYETILLSNNEIAGIENPRLTVTSYLYPVIKFINDAKHNLDICFYLITERNVVDAIVQAKKRNVKIRVIVDYKTGFIDNIGVNEFLKASIRVYSPRLLSDHLIMHHKFCIRDEEILLQGSLNLSDNSSAGSFDSIIITSDDCLVKWYQLYYNTLIHSQQVVLSVTI